MAEYTIRPNPDPTAHYRFEVIEAGEVVGRGATEKDARSLAEDYAVQDAFKAAVEDKLRKVES